MSYSLDPEQKAFIRRERAICTVLAGVLPAIAMWFLFSPFPLPMGGSEGFAVFLAKNTFGMVTVMTLLMTIGARVQIGKGRPARLDWRRRGHPILRWIPTWILLRAPLYGFLALLILAPASLAIARLLGFDLVERLPFVLFNLIYGSAVGFIMTPLILIAAMNDPQRAKTAFRAAET